MPPKKIKGRKPKRKVKIIKKVVIKEIKQPKQVFEYNPVPSQPQQTKIFKEIGDYTSEISKRNETAKKMSDLLERGTGLGLTLLEQALLSPDDYSKLIKERVKKERKESLSPEEFERYEKHMSEPLKRNQLRKPFMTKELEEEMERHFNLSQTVAKSDGGLGEKINLQSPINQINNPLDDNLFDNNLSTIIAKSDGGLGEKNTKFKIE